METNYSLRLYVYETYLTQEFQERVIHELQNYSLKVLCPTYITHTSHEDKKLPLVLDAVTPFNLDMITIDFIFDTALIILERQKALKGTKLFDIIYKN